MLISESDYLVISCFVAHTASASSQQLFRQRIKWTQSHVV